MSVPASCRIFTPEPLARAIVSTLFHSGPVSWLEPSVGSGVFLKALKAAGVKGASVVGIDLDPSCEAPEAYGQIHRGQDALAWMHAVGGRFDRILGNPPYVSLSNVRGDVRKAALETPLLNTGRKVSLNSNLWVPFVCAAANALSRDGEIAFVLPAAWDYASYAADLREFLPKCFRSFYVVRSAKPMFPSIQDGCIVIVGKGYGQKHRRFVRLECENLEDVCNTLRALSKNGFAGRQDQTSAMSEANQQSRPLSAFADIKIGAVAGDATYFILSESLRSAYRLPRSAVVPILSKARHLLSGAIGKREWELLRDADEPVWLFRPSAPALRSPAVKKYLDLASTPRLEIKSKSQVKSREPWYTTRMPRRIDGFMSGMTSSGPQISFRRMHNLGATNTLYVVSFKRRESRYPIALGLLSSEVWTQVSARGRRYPDGLLKLEPRDLGSLSVTPLHLPGARECYDEAIAAIRAGQAAIVRDEIDVLLRKQTRSVLDKACKSPVRPVS